MTAQNFSLKELSTLLNAEIKGNPNHLIFGVNTLEEASSNEASFLANPRYIEAMKSSSAGVICIDKNTDTSMDKNYLICLDPSAAFQKLIEVFSKGIELSGFANIHPTSVIHETASIGKNTIISPNAVIDKNVKIGDNCFIGANVYIGPNSTIGNDCILHPTAVIRESCILGNRVILQPGAVIGSCGFGYITDKMGQFKKLAQVGNVVLEDDVEIGANTTIDRARFKVTKIGKGTKIDNLVQIAHNVELGNHNAIASQTGISGSTKTGKHVIMGGQVGIVGHVELDDFVMLASRTGISKNMKAGKYRGSPAMPLDEYNRREVVLRKLPNILKSLEDKIKSLEEKLSALEK